MAKISKNRQAVKEKINKEEKYPLENAITLLKETAFAKFNESVDISINLGIDATKSDQTIRGSVILPNSSNKKIKVAVFASGDNAKKALNAGADTVGMDDLAKTIQSGDLSYDVIIAIPDAMNIVGKLGQLLGPRGLMPNPKLGTVNNDIETAVKNAKSGQVRYRADKGGVVHANIGSINIDTDKLAANVNALLAALKKDKPETAKGVYFKKISISSTMGAGIAIDITSTMLN